MPDKLNSTSLAVLLAESTAHHMFEEFRSGRGQGKNFSWAKFPGMVGRIAAASFPLHSATEVSPEDLELCRTHAEQFATALSRGMV